MDDIFNILFFAVAIIVFIVSAIRKNKRGAQKPKSNIQSSIEALFDIPQERQVIETNDFIQHVETNKEKVSKTVFENIIEKKHKERVSVIPDKIKEYEISDVSESDGTFDLRSAIIYKEILNRKEF